VRSFWNKTDVDAEQNFVQLGDIELPDDDPVQQGVYRGGSGRNLRLIWLKGEFPLPLPDDIFVVCNCASYKCMDYLILYHYDVASAVMSITGNS